MAVTLSLQKLAEADPSRGWAPTEFYDIVAAGKVVGSIQLRLGNTDYMRLYGGHVGYKVEPEHRGHGYASKALAALRPIAQHHGFDEIWITVRPDNIASCRTLEKAGASYEETVAVPLDSDLYARGDLHMRRYRLSV
ncbi:GNAT family N-acetyltransferase [Sphingobium sp. HBC34]|jgi:predicted acetyltransferase|uniref:GNAT family N-acetyltransferase n=1 Tax=Sphingobium cyanobacteriorum TaxID=3063954 RepID=A0ABT8ZSS9_9SPHN|nr:GNAT family N-acetyltransferase [Sphingobium sp. HBC34]MDK4807965.1 GNAT family N-acetyltransferase [Novosphingobium aromaticivorans]MDO7837590.1 GNAT family N-acetyltransferase [Sphingobium sp. HBC34]HIQ19154.1 GNAT family N-acetyltransferase [Novosphingobium capsulatum]